MLHEQIKNIFNNKPLRKYGWRKWPDCGDEMIAEINDLNPSLVLDLGCGNNIFKGHINNLIGVDILDNNKQDINAPIEDLPFDDNSVQHAGDKIAQALHRLDLLHLWPYLKNRYIDL